MAWPSPQDYSEAVQYPKTAFSENELQQGKPELNQLGLPRPRSGQFATVYKILCGKRNWAVRCFLNPVSDQQERYAAISAHLAKAQLAYLVQFSFLRQGIRVGQQTYPILKMEWVEGEPLIPFIERNLRNPTALLSLASRWLEMTKTLGRFSIAHGDLQHGNVLVLNGDLKLVDYDGMFVPNLSGKTSRELGQRNYQHPLRTEFDYGPNLDNFSSWVVYISLIALALQPQLWSQFRGGDECLVFRKEDFENPERSIIFGTLARVSDDRLRSAVALFRSLIDLGPQDVPSLDGRLLPSPASLPSVSAGGSWISDYVKLPSKTDTSRISAPPESEPTPSWIYDFISPEPLQSQLRAFENSVLSERVALGVSAFVVSMTAVGVYLRFIGAITSVLVAFLALLANWVLCYYRFKFEPALSALKTVNSELRVIAEKIDLAHAIIKSKQASTKSLHERYTFDQNKLSKDLESVRSAEKKELDRVQFEFNAEKNSIDARRKPLNQQQTGELQKLSNTLGQQLVSVNSKISALGSAESGELSTALAIQQNQYVISYLRNWTIEAASIPGIGAGFKARLRAAGVLTAADAGKMFYIKGFGQSRAAALAAWQHALRARAQAKMPKALSQTESDTIQRKYSSQRNALDAERLRLDRAIKEAEGHIRDKYRNSLGLLDHEESVALTNTQSKSRIVQKEYRDRYQPLEEMRRKLDEDLRRAVAEIEEKLKVERKNLFTLTWEQEKVRRRLREFSKITFSHYVRRVLAFA